MTELQLSRRLAEIIVYGHVLLLMYAVFVYFMGHLEGVDVLQMYLTGTPLLALAGVAGFDHVVNANVVDSTPLTERTQRQMTQFVAIAFILALLLLYTAGWQRTPVSTDNLKVGVGAVETGLGAYIGIIRDKFFVKRTNPAVGGGNAPPLADPNLAPDAAAALAGNENVPGAAR